MGGRTARVVFGSVFLFVVHCEVVGSFLPVYEQRTGE